MLNVRTLCMLAVAAVFVGGCQATDSGGSHAGSAGVASVATVYNVRTYGAKGDGKALDSGAINKAIEACAAAGGGEVYVGPGTYLCGSIHMKSNINLYLEMGATILGAPMKMNAYDAIEPFPNQGPKDGPQMAYQDGGHCYFHNSLIWGENLNNVAITGLGTINGGGMTKSDRALDEKSGYNNFARTHGGTIKASTPPTTTEPAVDLDKPIRMGNKAVAFKLCKNVTLKDITIYHGGHFAILVTGCDGMTVDNVTMDTDRDGIDIDCCRNTVVSNCRINSPFDDGLCPKSSYALGEQRPTENLTITNCQVSGWDEGTLLDGTMKPSKTHNGRIKFGTEASGGFRNVTVSNCTFRDCKGLALEEVDGALMDNITIDNLTMINVPDYAIYVTTGRRNRTPGLTEKSRARNILISNIVAIGAGPMSGIQVMGMPDMPVEGVRIENVRVENVGGGTKEQAERVVSELAAVYPEPGRLGVLPAYGVFVRHAKNMELANIHVSYAKEDLRSALICQDVDGLDVDHFWGEVADGATAARFEGVKNEHVWNSPMLMAEGAIVRKAEMAPVPDANERRLQRTQGTGPGTGVNP
jgi:Pectate lyase superfamily protein/Right handed beta helix region